jgi:hypothetical protein
VFTTEYGQRFADKAQSVAAELRSQDAPDGAAPEAAAGAAPDATADSTPDAAPEPAAAEPGDTGL